MALRTVHLPTLPACSFHDDRPAAYDAPTLFGPWAYMCDDCFATKSTGMTGSKLTDAPEPERDRHAEARAALEANDFEAFEDAVGDGDPIDYLM